MIPLVLVRHGQSTWNAENKFTGWTDVDLTPLGREEASHAADLIKERGLVFDLAYTSFLKRASETLRIILEGLGQHPLIKSSWRLNERHYGALQGLNKKETVAQYGEEQVKLWRRGYAIQPPALTRDDARWPGKDPKYKTLTPDEIPLTESLKDCLGRVIPYWDFEIVPQLHAGKRVLIAASGNSLRALIKHLDNVPEDEIVELNVPTGIPLVYELDEKTLAPLKHYYLEDEEKVKAAIEVVKHQT